jgi:hypothetical protein
MRITIDDASIPARIEVLGERSFQTLEPFHVVFSVDGSPRRVDIPAGLITDLGSVPRFARWLVSVADAPFSFIVHDALYAGHARGLDITRAVADRVMLALMDYRRSPRSWLRRRVIYSAVRAGGWLVYRQRDRRKNGP